MATPVVKTAALKYDWLDAPAIRKMHCEPMVRLGGIAIFVATIFSIVVINYFGVLPAFAADSSIVVMLLGGSGFFLIGLTDDLLELSAINRLWMQGVIASIVWWAGIRVETFALPGLSPVALAWLSLPVTVLWLAGVVNAINWIDGLDGLAAGVAGIGTGAVVIVGIVATEQFVLAVVGAALLGSLLGFLYYNAYPAKIFMGDGGSYFVGFMLASLCIVESQPVAQLAEYPLVGLLPLVILAVPLGDMCSVILARLLQGSSPFEADNRHLHHRLLGLGFSHRMTVWMVYEGCVIAGSLALVMVKIISLWLWVCGAFVLGLVMSWQVWQAQAATAAAGSLKNFNIVVGEET